MSEFSDALSDVNAACLSAFGDTVTYAQPAVDPFTIVARRVSRDPAESESLAAFERIWTVESQFTSQNQQLPRTGDLVTIGGIDYVVHSVKPDVDPAGEGMRIYLNRRFPSK